ncbi:hypothetical protein BKA70DRAFT_1259889 [Coprinopsis sp. MPI-PUGE-AT-0042]|nr:hypothetical protein BKA70DRAFT_1259889 [Coprinopsis sp. MPI-PUGE-AT-0042]
MFTSLAVLSLAAVACAREIVITVGGNTTNDVTTVFEPREVRAFQGDVVVFNFTQGNHTATQALFASPCVPAHRVNETVNGFDSGFRQALNFTAITTLEVPITDNDTTIWFYDYNTCAEGGVGVINVNETSLETIDGFERNAIRLNGTDSDNSPSPPRGTQRPTGPDNDDESTDEGSAKRAVAMGAMMVTPLLALASIL